MESLLLTVILITLVAAVAVLAMLLYKRVANPRKVETSATIINRIEPVFKVVTVEGHFSEVLQFKEKYRVFFDLIPQKKEALVVVKGKVLMGMDLKRAKFTADEEGRKITLNSLPEPEVISMETDLQYFDMKASMFKSFNADDITELHERAKELIRQKADEGHLQLMAEKQAAQIVDVVRVMIEQRGWGLTIDPKAQKLLDGKE